MDHVIRYVITHVNRDGMRTLTFHAQGSYTYDDEAVAKKALDSFMANSRERLIDVHGPQSAGTFEVRPVPCYLDHHDPKTVWFDN